MTLHTGYALAAHESLDEFDMGDGSLLSLKVTGAQSNGIVTVIGGEVTSGWPPRHLHEVEDEVVICLSGQLSLLNCLAAAIPGGDRVVSAEEVFELPHPHACGLRRSTQHLG